MSSNSVEIKNPQARPEAATAAGPLIPDIPLEPMAIFPSKAGTQQVGLHKVFRTDQRLTEDEISSLLGIKDMHRKERITVKSISSSRNISALQMAGLGVFALLVAGMILVSFVYMSEPASLQADLSVRHLQ